MATLYSTKTSHQVNGDPVTDPIRLRPKSMSRAEWRQLMRIRNRAIKRQRKADAKIPEPVKLDRRLHAAGLVSPRDYAAIRPVSLHPEIEGV